MIHVQYTNTATPDNNFVGDMPIADALKMASIGKMIGYLLSHNQAFMNITTMGAEQWTMTYIPA